MVELGGELVEQVGEAGDGCGGGRSRRERCVGERERLV